MKLYKIERKQCHASYEEYIAAIVCAQNEDEASSIHPGMEWVDWSRKQNAKMWKAGEWVISPDMVEATYIGDAASWMSVGVVLASYKHG